MDKKKTTMSVPEMRRMLGLRKTDSYWLVHKQCFETVMVKGKMRIVIDSFEHWYANQVKYKKVDGPPPGEELRSYSYSPQELAEELGVSDSIVYDLIKRYDIETFEVDYWMRIHKDVFAAWYKTQFRYRTKADRDRDAELEAASMTMPEMARLLLISRKEVYNILLTGRDAPTLFHAIEVCEDERLKLSINLAFACSLRIGELLGLTWDCVDISPESIAAGKACIYVNKELQRVSKSVMKTLEKKDVLRVFPELRESNKTVLVLKKPKTATSTRKIFLPKTVAEMLVEWKRDQDFTKEALGSEYADFDLVMANGLGMPTEQSRITALFAELIEKNDLPKVVFHSLRHSSITYKLKLNGGDIKSVQGDSGHAQAQMVTDQYSHILDDDRKNNAALFERAFYSGKGVESVEAPAEPEDKGPAAPAGVDPELLAKILSNPEMAALLTSLAKSLN